MSQSLDAVLNVLYRDSPVDELTSLRQAVQPSDQGTLEPFEDSAVCLDANVLLKIANSANSSDIVDYLGSQHAGPIVVSSQALQEYWNNSVSAVLSVGDLLRKKFEELEALVSTINPIYGDSLTSRIVPILDDFRTEFGHVLDDRKASGMVSLIDMITTRARTPQAPRRQLRDLAEQRKRTKTPPGFKDAGDGDFFIWVDCLLGLMDARAEGSDFRKVILVTDDVKKDWSTQGTAHPTLAAEVSALLAARFETWTLKKLSSQISGRT